MTGLGQFLRTKRAELGMTQIQLATSAQVDPSSLSRWEREVTEPSLSEYRRVCAALGTEPGVGLAETKPKPPRRRKKGAAGFESP